MQELLYVRTTQFELTVWCNDTTKRQQAYQATLAKRGSLAEVTTTVVSHQDPAGGVEGRSSLVYFSPPLAVLEAELVGKNACANQTITQFELGEPLFFENMQYHFEWIFPDNEHVVTDARLTHRRHRINEGFRFAKVHRSIHARFTGSVNTGNHVGWMCLPLEYVIAGQTHYSQLSFEVLPTKMDLYSDLSAMYHTIDRDLPLWRFSLMGTTDQDAAKGQHRGNFPLLWLANFRSLRAQLEQGLKVIAQAPHSRLQSYVSYSKADRLKGRLPYRLSEKVKEDLKNGLQEKRYRVEKKRLSVDTPENRFIKMVVLHSKKTLINIEDKLRQDNHVTDKSGEQPRLSAAFLDELHKWQQPLQKTLNQSFLKEVGAYKELRRASLVLQQKTGYSSVYRVWQELKFYLDMFANQSSVSMKSVADIYEVWCFLTIRTILLELGFIEQDAQRQSLTLSHFFEHQLTDGLTHAFRFYRDDGVTAKLAHEPRFGKKGADIRSYLVNQKPDIVLEVTFPQPSGQHFIWLFDAKYRIELDDKNRDRAPDDALNQMHRYRDALIRIDQENTLGAVSKSRPVFGAFALYPGFFDQLSMNNLYDTEINEVGIGAFALLPSATEQGGQNSNGHYWLQEFLREQIGDALDKSAPYNLDTLEERLYVQEAARTPYYGMKQVFYPNLTMTAALGPKGDRAADYFKAFQQGSASFYHMPTKTFNLKFKYHIATELRFLALSFFNNLADQHKSIYKIWPIKSVQILPRDEITEEQAGKQSVSKEPYFVFELGKALTLSYPITNVPSDSFRSSMKLTTLEKLDDVKVFGEIEEVYKEGLV